MASVIPAMDRGRMSKSDIDAAAARLAAADERGVPCAPVRDLIGPDDVDAAYAVQSLLVAARRAQGAVVVGRKIGLTSKAVQAQLGVDQPDFGVLFAEMQYNGGDTIEHGVVLQPRAEAEIAFVLGRDLADGCDLAQVREAIDYAVAAIEVCGSRIADWDISLADTVADNASSGVYVLGPERRTLANFEPREVTMTMTIDREPASSGAGSECLGDPLEAVAWLARQARDFGDPLRAGQLVLSGALGPMRPVAPGSTVRAGLSGLGSVQFRMGEESS